MGDRGWFWSSLGFEFIPGVVVKKGVGDYMGKVTRFLLCVGCVDKRVYQGWFW